MIKFVFLRLELVFVVRVEGLLGSLIWMVLFEERLYVVLILGDIFFRLFWYRFLLIELSLLIFGVNILMSFGNLKYFVFFVVDYFLESG